MVSAVMLVGFLVVAAVQLGLVVIQVLLLLWVLPGPVAAQVAVPVCIATVGVMAYATWHALHVRRSRPAGVPVARSDAPRLWAVLDDAARAVRTRPPDTVTVVAEAAATLDERTRLFGLIGGRRDLYLGLPLLQAWNVAHIQAVVAHELAHSSPVLGRFAPLAHRGRVAVCCTVPRISRRNPAGPGLRAYARLYRRVDAPLSLAQELAADRLAARFAGAWAAAAVLRELPLLEAAQQLFYAEYVGPGWQAGHVPDDIFGGLLRVLAARAEELAALRAREPLTRPGPWDLHPPTVDRLAALAAGYPPAALDPPPAATAAPPGPGASPVGAGEPGAAGEPGTSSVRGTPTGASWAEDRSDAAPPVAGSPGLAPRPGDPAGSLPAVDLVPDLPDLGRALQRIAFPAQGRTTLSWDDFFGAARTAEMQREADAALATLSRAAGTPITHAGEVLDLAADGRLGKAVEIAFPGGSAESTAERIAELITLLVALASLRCGAARWRHSWTGTAELVAADGSPFDLAEIAELAGTRDTVGAARELAAELGIDLAAAGQVGSTRTAARAEVVSGLVNLVVGGARTDLLIVDTGLLLVPGVPRSQSGSAKRRLAHFAAADQPERQTTVPGSRFVPFEDVAGAVQVRRTPRTWDLSLRDGSTLTLRSALGSDELPGGWAALDDAMAFLSSSR